MQNYDSVRDNLKNDITYILNHFSNKSDLCKILEKDEFLKMIKDDMKKKFTNLSNWESRDTYPILKIINYTDDNPINDQASFFYQLFNLYKNKTINNKELINSSFKINFQGINENGQDVGGPIREFYDKLSKEIKGKFEEKIIN